MQFFKRLIKITLLLIVIVVAVYGFAKYQESQAELEKLKGNPSAVLGQETKALVGKVSKLMELPEKENPTIAEITDVKKLKDQPFFAKAQNGDKVLIYSLSKKAILYRPSVDKIIEVASVNLGQAQAQETPTLQQSGNGVRIAIYISSTTSAEMTDKVEQQLKEQLPSVTVVLKDFTKRKNYYGTLIVNLGRQNQDIANQLKVILNGEIGQFPQGEIKPDADFLVILGK